MGNSSSQIPVPDYNTLKPVVRLELPEEISVPDRNKFKPVNWLELPEHLTWMLMNKIVHIRDIIRFGAVCSSWQFVYLEYVKFKRLPRQIPFLMLPSAHIPRNQMPGFYSLLEKRVCKFQLLFPQDRDYRASSYGWLVTVSQKLDISLFNPFLSVSNEIHLPPIADFKALYYDHSEFYLRKAILSSNPCYSSNYVVMAIHDSKDILCFWGPGDEAWTTVEVEHVVDIIYYNDQFYALDRCGAVFAIDLSRGYTMVTTITPSLISPHPMLPDTEMCFCRVRYIVESSGHLLQIIRDVPWTTEYKYSTTILRVFKLDLSRVEWVEVSRLGNCFLFLGDNTSMSLSTSDFPEFKANRIYFTDDFEEKYGRNKIWYELPDGFGPGSPHDVGVFNLEDGSIEALSNLHFTKNFRAPIWIEPSC